MADPNWNKGDYYDGLYPTEGLRLARQAGTITYRSGPEWQTRFGRSRTTNQLKIGENFEIEKYIRHQGSKWASKGGIDPNSVIWMSTAMDAFTLEKEDKSGKLSLMEGIKEMQHPSLIIGVQTDVLFPVWQQKEVADILRRAGNEYVTYYELDSLYGHDTFLLDKVAVGGAVKGHLEQEPWGANRMLREAACGASLILNTLLDQDFSAVAREEVFYALDTDHDGCLVADEVVALLYLILNSRGKKMSLKEVTDFVSKFDSNSDGRITKKEFLDMPIS
eukprot:CAMPEP_0184504632 /NCGR_PEP_ID=MMETSP0113_2-20130426/52567_1 /TAXON_ID=91329 /ORGANISM="Norrisiella sphaerica, Strain BC52" /LENGTH=276 /DNA_ID=CAMNT_0026894285 /DNA_START=959 /DNA_END=1789 /DNA_ORIENTATION=-